MTYRTAAERVLKAARSPLTTAEITDAALRRGLIKPSGKTPEATMSAVLYRAIISDPEGPIQREYEPIDEDPDET